MELNTQHNVQVSSKSYLFLILNQNSNAEWIVLVNGKAVPQNYLINGLENGFNMPYEKYSVTMVLRPQYVQNLLNYLSAFSGNLISLLMVLDFKGSFGKLKRVLKNAGEKRNNGNGKWQ